MGPGEEGRVGLDASVVGELVLEHLTRGHAGDRELPARGRAVERHLHVLLAETRTDVVQDHVLRRAAAEVEPRTRLGGRKSGQDY